MLLAGGYFRARIPTLSPFDKVVGGMVWSITASNVDVDVDLLFEENSTIGQRIHLSEQIVKALVKMQSPSPLQSHQIQGLDYAHLLPVIKWLVRKVIETRQLTGDEVRALSIAQFGKDGRAMPGDEVADEVLDGVGVLVQQYKAQRKFKKREDATFESEVGRVEATLLEYGEKIYGASRVDEENEEKKRARAAQGRGKLTQEPSAEDTARARLQAEQEQAQRVQALQQQLFASQADGKISGSVLGEMVALGADDIREADAAYASVIQRAGGADALGVAKDAKAQEELRHKRQVEALKRRIAEAERMLETRGEPLAAAEARVAELTALLASKQALIAQALAEIEKVAAVESDADKQELIARLRGLVTLNESLKKQESEFKQMCRAERQRLLDQIANHDSGEGDEEVRKMLEVERIFEGDAAKVLKLRQMLAKKNQEIAKTSRAIDDIPARTELLQFERRFVELYELLSEKFTETRKYYTLYNTLTSSYDYLVNELTLLESIIQNFPIGMKTPQGRDSMVRQFKVMMEGVAQSRKQVRASLDKERELKEALSDKYSRALERQRAYFKLVKEFQEECQANEKLGALAQRLGIIGADGSA